MFLAVFFRKFDKKNRKTYQLGHKVLYDISLRKCLTHMIITKNLHFEHQVVKNNYKNNSHEISIRPFLRSNRFFVRQQKRWTFLCISAPETLSMVKNQTLKWDYNCGVSACHWVPFPQLPPSMGIKVSQMPA